MSFKRLLIANRGEIAIRVMEAASALELGTVALFSEDDARSLHVVRHFAPESSEMAPSSIPRSRL